MGVARGARADVGPGRPARRGVRQCQREAVAVTPRSESRSRKSALDRPGAVWGPPPAFAPPPDEARAALAAVYVRVDAALAGASDACRACGRCCRFEPGGLHLFASALELAYLLAEAGPPARDRLAPGSTFERPWTCPYQSGNACGARRGRPLGCRTHFCDPVAGAQGRALYDAALADIRAASEAHGVPWWYGPAKVYLDAVAADGSGRSDR